MPTSAASLVVAAVVLLHMISTCKIEVRALLHDITVEGGEVHWDYTDGPHGPANWHKLKPEWAACAGQQQSPLAVDAKDMVTDPLLGRVEATYNLKNETATIIKSAHDIVVEMPEGSGFLSISGDRGSYQVSSFHYHMPSEHRILNQSFPLELHVVHWKFAGRSLLKRFAVVSFLFVEGAESKFWAQLDLARLSSLVPDTRHPVGQINLMELGKTYGRYMGSFTTPPCKEHVSWTVNLWNFPTVSKSQLEHLRAGIPTLKHINNRPTFSSAGRGFRMSS